MSYSNLIEFASEKQKAEWCSGNVDPKLARIFLEAAVFARSKGYPMLRVTSIYRDANEDVRLGGSGIHVTWRAIDIGAPGWNDNASATVAAEVNRRWVYDRKRPNLKVALYDEHGTGPHIHFQVHVQTEER